MKAESGGRKECVCMCMCVCVFCVWINVNIKRNFPYTPVSHCLHSQLPILARYEVTVLSDYPQSLPDFFFGEYQHRTQPLSSGKDSIKNLLHLPSFSALPLLVCQSDVFQSHSKLCPSDRPRRKPHPRVPSKWLKEAGSHGAGRQAQPPITLAEAQIPPDRFHPRRPAAGWRGAPSWYVGVIFYFQPAISDGQMQHFLWMRHVTSPPRSVWDGFPDLQRDVRGQAFREAGHRGWLSQRLPGGTGQLQAPIVFWQTEETGTGCDEAAEGFQRQVGSHLQPWVKSQGAGQIKDQIVHVSGKWTCSTCWCNSWKSKTTCWRLWRRGSSPQAPAPSPWSKRINAPPAECSGSWACWTAPSRCEQDIIVKSSLTLKAHGNVVHFPPPRCVWRKAQTLRQTATFPWRSHLKQSLHTASVS